MWRLLWDADGVAEVSFILWWQQLFPLQCGSPGNFSPVDVDVDGQILEEGVELGGVVICHVEETFEHLDSGALFLEELDDCLLFPLVGGGGVWQ